MDFQETKNKLEALKKELVEKVKDLSTTKEELQRIQKSIDNYEYIIELTEMNHFERGAK